MQALMRPCCKKQKLKCTNWFHSSVEIPTNIGNIYVVYTYVTTFKNKIMK